MAPTLMFGACDISHVCMWMRASERERSCLRALVILLPIFVSCYHSVHVSFSLKGPDVTACFPYQRQLVYWETKKKRKKKWAREWDWAATPVLASVCSQLVCGNAGGREAQSARCHCWTCLGSVSSDWHSEAHFVLSEGFTLGCNDFDFILNKKKE